MSPEARLVHQPDPSADRTAARLQLLVGAANAILLHTDPQKLLGELFDLLSAFCQLEVCFSYWVSGDRLRLAYSTGVSEETAQSIAWLDYGQAVCGTVARDRCRMTVDDIQHSVNPLVSLVRSMGIQAYACHPLIARGRLLGTLSYGTRQRAQFNDEELSLMQAVSDQVALAVDRILVLRELEQQNRRLVTANASLEQFAYSASHDLQEPIRTVRAFAQMLAKRGMAELSPENREALNILLEGSNRMHRLVEGLFEYTRLATGSEAGAGQRTSLGAALEDAVANLRGTLDGNPVEVAAETLPEVGVSRAHAMQIFQNLLSNAVKYRRNGPAHIRVWAEAARDQVTVHVADNGIGIEAEYQERIFGLFKRLHGSEVPGAGMGLAIVKRVVEIYGGRIWVESTPGAGATFTFTLPG